MLGDNGCFCSVAMLVVFLLRRYFCCSNAREMLFLVLAVSFTRAFFVNSVSARYVLLASCLNWMVRALSKLNKVICARWCFHIYARANFTCYLGPFLYRSIRDFVRSFARSLVRSFIHSFAHSFVQSFAHSFVHLFIYRYSYLSLEGNSCYYKLIECNNYHYLVVNNTYETKENDTLAYVSTKYRYVCCTLLVSALCSILYSLFADSRFIYPSMEKFTIQLMSPLSWEIIPNTR